MYRVSAQGINERMINVHGYYHQCPLKCLGPMKTGSNTALKHAHKQSACVGKDYFHLDANDFGFICAGVSNVGSYKRNT